MRDYLFDTPFTLEQKPDMYHFSSDSELLGRFLRLSEADRVLDVGTNNGVLLCYAATMNPQSLTGIDLFEEVIDTASDNLRFNHIPAELLVCRLQDLKHEPFTSVIANPPYFTNSNDSLKKANRYLRAARHADHLSLEELFFHSARLLADNGKLCMVFPVQSQEHQNSCALANGFAVERFRYVYDRPGGNVLRYLAEYRKGGSVAAHQEPDVFLDRLHTDESGFNPGNE